MASVQSGEVNNSSVSLEPRITKDTEQEIFIEVKAHAIVATWWITCKIIRVNKNSSTPVLKRVYKWSIFYECLKCSHLSLHNVEYTWITTYEMFLKTLT